MTNALYACWRADMRESLTLTVSLQLHLFEMSSALLLLCQSTLLSHSLSGRK